MSDESQSPEPGPIPFNPSHTMIFPAPSLGREAEPAQEDVHSLRVEVLGGPMDGLSVSVNRADLTIGRGSANDLSLGLDPMVSTAHARLVREGQHYFLQDLGSRNGTYLGDQAVRERVLIGPGTTFVLGQTPVEFMPR